MKKQYLGLMLVGLFFMGCQAQESTNGYFVAFKNLMDLDGDVILSPEDTPAKSQFNWQVNEALEGNAELIVYNSQGRLMAVFKMNMPPSSISLPDSKEKSSKTFKTTMPLQCDHLIFADITRTVTPYDETSDSMIFHKEKIITSVRLLLGQDAAEAQEQNVELGAYRGEENRLVSTTKIIQDDHRDRYPDHWQHGDGMPARPPWSWDDPRRRRPKD